MSASLVGSEMCIRDRDGAMWGLAPPSPHGARACGDPVPTDPECRTKLVQLWFPVFLTAACPSVAVCPHRLQYPCTVP
eukprot:10768583-Alexandrium_andersonii.AAC.1